MIQKYSNKNDQELIQKTRQTGCQISATVKRARRNDRKWIGKKMTVKRSRRTHRQWNGIELTVKIP